MNFVPNDNLTASARSPNNFRVPPNPESTMSDFQKKHLETNYENWKAERCPELPNCDAFEIYTIEQVLKSKDPADEDIEFGNVGGGMDGGVDGFYFYVDQKLVRPKEKVPTSAKEAELLIIQSRYSPSWEEDVLLKFQRFSKACFDWGKHLDSVKFLKDDIKDLMQLFRDACDVVLPNCLEFHIRFYYINTSAHLAGVHLKNLANEVKATVVSQMGQANVEFHFWGANELLKSVRDNPFTTVRIPSTQTPLATADGSTVCLVKLSDYAKFITDEKSGQINNRFFESNVRDFQGEKGINTDIKATVDSTDPYPEFWWLNNGITIIAEKCIYGAGHIEITSPEIVNGLQTSHQIFQSFKDNPARQDVRNVLLRVIVTNDDAIRIRVIKATNTQNSMHDLQTKAYEPVHLNIQDALRRYGLFYDRRKGQCRREKRPLSKTAGSYSLAQMVIAIFLQRPSDARSRTTSTIKEQENIIFDDSYDKKFYASCFMIHLQVGEFMSKTVPERDIRARLRYHVAMLATCELTKAGKPSVEQLSSLAQTLTAPIATEILKESLKVARKEYNKNPEDKYSKSVQFQEKLRAYAHKKYPVL